MSTIKQTPKTFTVKGHEWTEDEAKALKELYSGRASIELAKADIWENALLQKALNCEVVCTTVIDPTAQHAILQLTQLGLDLRALV